MVEKQASATVADVRWLRYSLVFVWLWTAVASVWELQGQSRSLLLAGGIADAGVANLLVLAGAALDAVLGLWLWLRPGRPAYRVALAAMLLMTGVATVLIPSLWLHPLGPLSKNLPIAAILWVLARRPA